MSTRPNPNDAAVGDVLAAAAVTYAAAGLPVLPLHNPPDGRCSCGAPDCSKPGKHPRNRNGLNGASTDVAVVAEWWRRWPKANVGIRTGAESGLVILDVDVQHSGAGTLAKFEREHGKLPSTAETLTGGGGRHVCFKHPGDEVRNSAGKLGPGLDVRGDGGYIVAPPSVHESGRVYKWTRTLERGLADPPPWLLENVPRAAHLPNGSAPVEKTIPVGSRNATLTSLAGAMRRRGMDAEEIVASLRVVNERCEVLLPDDEVYRIAASVSRYEPDAEIASPGNPSESEAPFSIAVMTARELCALPDPPPEDLLLGPVLVRGCRTLVGGTTGHGKTTLAVRMLKALALGGNFLDWEAAGGGRVLIVDVEQGLRSIKKQLREAGLDECDLIDYVRIPDGLSLNSSAQQVGAIERVLERGAHVAAMFDPLYKLHTGDSNDERAAVDLMRIFDAWRERYHFALLLPAHCRKPVAGLKFSIHDLFGSSAYTRGAEVVIAIQFLRQGYSRLHFLKDRDGELPVGGKWGLLFDRESGYRRDPKDEQAPTAERLAELRATDPNISQAQAAEALGVTDRTVRKYWRDDEQPSLLGDDGGVGMIVRGATSRELARRVRRSLRFTELVLHDLQDRELVKQDSAGLWWITVAGLRHRRALRDGNALARNGGDASQGHA